MTTWYRQGVVTLANNSDIVTGTGTQWVDDVLPGGIFYTPTLQYEVLRVISDTSLQLVKPYAGPSAANIEYAIAPTQGYVVNLAKQFGLVLQTFGDVKDAWAAGTLIDTGVLAQADGSNKMGFKAAGDGAITRKTQAKLRERYSLADYFEPSEGAPAMLNALNRVFAVAERTNVEVDLGENAWTLNSDFVIPVAKRAIFRGRGSVNFAGGSIVRTVHGKLTMFEGFTATGANSMFRFVSAPSGTATKDYEIDCIETFMNPGVWAVYLDGAREGSISRAYFRSGAGVYRTLSNICIIDRSHFLGLDYAILDDGKGSGFSCGLYVSHTEILGCNRSVVVSQCDDGELMGCTIDYNDEGIYLIGQDRFKINGGYIGTRTAERATPNVAVGGTTPALIITGTASIPSEKIKVLGACFTGHHLTDGQYDNVSLDNTTSATFADTDFTFWTRNGIRYGANVTSMNVHDSTFANRGGTGTYAIECTSTDDSTNRFHDNILPAGKGILAPFANIRRNTRFLTSQQGESVAVAGAGSVAATLALAYTPLKSDVQLTPTNAAGAAAGPYISSVSATQLVIGFATVPTANAGVRWRVEKNQIAG